MKARVILLANEKYKVEWKTFIFWHNFSNAGYGVSDSEYTNTYYFDTEKIATQAMIKMVQGYEIKRAKEKRAGVVKEFTSEELKEKFAEHWL